MSFDPPPSGSVRRRLDDLLAERGLAAVWLGTASSFAWATGGDNTVDRSHELGVAAVGYDGESFRVVTSNIEARRIREEEVSDAIPVETFDWHETDLAGAVAAASDRPAAADFPVEGFERVDATALRQPLTDSQVDRYRDLGREVATVVESVCRDLVPATTEREAAASLRGRLAERNVDTPVALVGGARRSQRYRHYVPRDEPLGAYALVSVTARRGGLHASCTRTVAFDPPDWLADRHAAAARVEASALAATRETARTGGTAADVFERIREAYAAVGHEGEWRNHHQGGAAGFAGREWVATPTLDRPVEMPMAYAWNPTVQGAKSEDTVLVTADGVEVLTATGEWPTLTVETVGGDLSLARPAVLSVSDG